MIRIALWSGPRNLSTALLRAWENRADTLVIDEPFYGAYLASTGLDHPMRAETLARHPTDWDDCARLCASCAGAPIIAQKHMTQHMIEGAPLDWMAGLRHAFLIRPPAAVAASFRRGWAGMCAADLGFAAQARLFDHVVALTGRVPPVIEAEDLAARPEPVLRALCAGLEVPFDPAMLAWPRGARASDGVWAPHWYRSVRQSTGFAPLAPAVPEPELAAIIADCTPAYQHLRAHLLAA